MAEQEQTDIVLSEKQAVDVIEAAREHGVIEAPTPDGKVDRIELAGNIVWQAEAFERNELYDPESSPAVPAILKIARDKSYFDPGEHGNPTLDEVKSNGVVAPADAPAEQLERAMEAQVEHAMKSIRAGHAITATQEVYNEAVRRINAATSQEIEHEQIAAANREAEVNAQEAASAAGYPGVDSEAGAQLGLEEDAAQAAQTAPQVEPPPAEKPWAEVRSAVCKAGKHDDCGGTARVQGKSHTCECPCHSAQKPGPEDDLTPTSKAVMMIGREGLPIPADIEGDAPTLPRDISKLSDIELRSLHGQFHFCLSRAIWLVAIRDSDMEDVEELLSDRIGQCLRVLEAIEENSKRSVTSLKAEAQDDEQVRSLKTQRSAVRAEYKVLRALKEVFSENCARISREMSFREMERQSAQAPAASRR